MEEARQPATLEAAGEFRARKRLRGLAIHFAVFLVAMGIAVPANFLLYPERIVVMFPMVLWGAPLALHAAYAMGLFDIFKRDAR